MDDLKKLDLKECVAYDVEIARRVEETPGGWDNPEGMWFGSAVAYDFATGRYHFYLHEIGRLNLMDRLDGRIAVTFNGIKFDSRVMLGNDRVLVDDDVTVARSAHISWGNCDLLLHYVRARFGCRSVREAEERLGDKAIHDGTFGLDGLCEGCFGENKSGHGSLAPGLYQDGKFDELLEYNLQDVRLTKKLFLFARQYGYMVDRAGRVVRIG